MRNYIKSYSAFIKLVKYIMPIIAITLFSSIFLFKKKNILVPEALSITAELLNLTKKQKIINPKFSGLTNFGDSFILKAFEAMPDSPKPEKIKLTEPNLEFNALRGIGFIVKSNKGSINFIKQSARLNGNVFIEITNGYKILSENIKLNLKLGNLIAPGKVEGYGPSGKVIAGSMEIFRNIDIAAHNANGSLRFYNGVRLIYLPSTVN